MPESQPVVTDAVLHRRRFIRGGALLAAATGGAVAASVVTAVPAAADNGEVVKVGQTYFGQDSTVLQTSDAGKAPLNLSNAEGPALYLAPLDGWDKTLFPGDVVSTHVGPKVGVDYGDGMQATFLATFLDLDALPDEVPFEPERILDTTTGTGRATIVDRSGSGAIDSKGRLTKGSWVDVAVGSPDDEYVPLAAYVTATSSGSSKDGALTVYPPKAGRGGTVTTSFLKGKTLSGSGFIGTDLVGAAYAVRVYASQTTKVALDLTGLRLVLNTEDAAAARRSGAGAAARRKSAERRRAARR